MKDYFLIFKIYYPLKSSEFSFLKSIKVLENRVLTLIKNKKVGKTIVVRFQDKISDYIDYTKPCIPSESIWFYIILPSI